MSAPPVHILAVCLGNICRSPTAEAAIREAAAEAGVDVVVDSAGTGGWHEGDPPDARMTLAAGTMGLRLEGQARRVTPEDFSRFDLIVAMDKRNHDDLVALAPHAADRIRMFRSFDPDADDLEVPDPYYGGERQFREVVTMVRAAARGLIAHLASGV